RERLPLVRHPGLQRLPGGEVHEDLHGGAHVDDPLDHSGDAVLPRRPLGLEADPLRPDDHLRGPPRVAPPLPGDELELAKPHPPEPFGPAACASIRLETPRKSATYAVLGSS